jgi:hypothetical protein
MKPPNRAADGLRGDSRRGQGRSRGPVKKPYSAPHLNVRGSVSDLTRKGHLGPDGTKSVSDRAMKTSFAPVDVREVLEKLASLPVESWSYQGAGADVRHIGPMAQDFAAAFAVGDDERTITGVDAAGVAIAAIQGLNQLLNEREREVRNLRMQVEGLAGRLEAIEAGANTEALTGR